MKTGLVMEGGAMRGLFTAGVIDVFMENNVVFDGAIGVSAGATFGCNYKSGQIGRVLRYNCQFCRDYRYGSMKSWLRTGDMFDVDFCYRELPGELDIFDTDSFASNPMEFYVVATDIERGKPVYYKCSDGLEHDLEWIRASASLPIVSRTVEVDGYKLLDGGISDSVPLSYFESIGYDRNVVILTRPDSYRKGKNKMLALCRAKYRKYPEFVRIIADRHIRYNANIGYIREQEAAGNVFVIRPKEGLDVKSAENDPEKLRKVYEQGREAAMEAVKHRNLEAWLAGSGLESAI